MRFKPNYNLQRADRNRAKEQRKQEKLLRREQRAAERNAAQEAPQEGATPTENDAGVDETMARKKHKADAAFVLFDVTYDDGRRSSNRKVPTAELDEIDGDASARAFIEGQDRAISERSGKPFGAIKSVTRSPVR